MTYLSKWHILYVIFLVCHLFIFLIFYFLSKCIPQIIKRCAKKDDGQNPGRGNDDGNVENNISSSQRTDESCHETLSIHSSSSSQLFEDIENNLDDLEMNMSLSHQNYENEEPNHERPASDYQSNVEVSRAKEHLVRVAQNYPLMLSRTTPQSSQELIDQQLKNSSMRSPDPISARPMTRNLTSNLSISSTQVVQIDEDNDFTTNNQSEDIQSSYTPPNPRQSRIDEEFHRNSLESIGSVSLSAAVPIGQVRCEIIEYEEHHYVNLDDPVLYNPIANEELPATSRRRKPLPTLQTKKDV